MNSPVIGPIATAGSLSTPARTTSAGKGSPGAPPANIGKGKAPPSAHWSGKGAGKNAGLAAAAPASSSIGSAAPWPCAPAASALPAAGSNGQGLPLQIPSSAVPSPPIVTGNQNRTSYIGNPVLGRNSAQVNLDPMFAAALQSSSATQQASQLCQEAAQLGDAESLAPPFKIAISNMLAEWKQHSESVIQSSQRTAQHELHQTVQELVTKLDANTQRQMAQHQNQLTQHTTDIHRLETILTEVQKNQQQIFTSLSHCTKAVEVASSMQSSFDHSREVAWDAEPDPTIRAHIHELVSKSAFAECVVPWLAKSQMKLGEHFVLPGSDATLQQNWVIAFHGDHGIAAKKCRLALRSMKISHGKWDQLRVQTLTERCLQCYLSPDKSLKRQAVEVCSKKLGAILERHVASEEGAFQVMRAEGVVFLDLEPLAVVEPLPSGAANIKWNEQLVLRLKLDREGLAKELELTQKAGNNSQALQDKLAAVKWCL